MAGHQMGGAWGSSLSQVYMGLGARRSEGGQRGARKALALDVGWERVRRKGFLGSQKGPGRSALVLGLTRPWASWASLWQLISRPSLSLTLELGKTHGTSEGPSCLFSLLPTHPTNPAKEFSLTQVWSQIPGHGLDRTGHRHQHG